jgi:hypothetical protein
MNFTRTLGGFLCAFLTVASLTLGCGALMQGGAANNADPKAELSNREIAQANGAQIGARIADIRAKRQAALAAPGDFAAANAYGSALYVYLRANSPRVRGVDWVQYTKDAATVIGSSEKTAPPEQAAEALVMRVAFLEALSDTAGAMQTMREAFARAHTFHTGVGIIYVYGKERNHAQAQSVCEATRKLAKSDDDVFQLLDTCLQAVEEKPTSAEAMPWVSAEDWAMFKQRSQQRREQRLAARQAERERDDQFRLEEDQRRREREAAKSRPSGGSAPPGGGRASFTLRNACPKTVKIFYGKTPKFGSGRSSSIGSNTVQHESMDAGEMIWIVDDSGNGISNFTASAGVREVEIGAGCTSFITR